MVVKTVRTDDVQDVTARAVDATAVESLADLGKAAALLDAPPAPAGETAQAAAVVVQDQAGADDLVDVLRMARDMAAPMIEAMGYMRPGQVKEIWSDAQLRAIAEPAIEIMRRHGVGLAEALDKLGPYVGLIVGLWMPCLATWQAIKANIAAAQQAKAHEQQQQA